MEVRTVSYYNMLAQDYPGLKKILIQDKKYLVAKILFNRVVSPFLHPSSPTVSPFGFVLKKDDDFRLIPYLFLSSSIYRILFENIGYL